LIFIRVQSRISPYFVYRLVRPKEIPFLALKRVEC
jgi:hypothetical protein